MICGLLVLLAIGRRRLGAIVLVAALVFGTLIGSARMHQGGHFASDVLWAAGVMWFVAAGLFPLLGLHRNPYYEPARPVGSKMPVWVPLATSLGLILLVGAVSLAWPHRSTNVKTLVGEGEFLPDSITLTLDLEGALELAPGPTFGYASQSKGFGLPQSKLHTDRDFAPPSFKITHRREGLFTELQTRSRITLPPNRVYRILLGPKITSVHLKSPGEFDPASFAHVLLHHYGATPLRGIGGKDDGEDFFGRRIRAFSF